MRTARRRFSQSRLTATYIYPKAAHPTGTEYAPTARVGRERPPTVERKKGIRIAFSAESPHKPNVELYSEMAEVLCSETARAVRRSAETRRQTERARAHPAISCHQLCSETARAVRRSVKTLRQTERARAHPAISCHQTLWRNGGSTL